MSANTYSVERVPGFENNERHGIAVLKSPEDRFVDFASELDRWLDGKNPKVRRGQGHKIGVFLAGLHSEDVHKYDKSQKKGRDYPDACTFEHEGSSSRIYGFRCWPDRLNRRFELRVLVRFTDKHEWETDERNLKRCQELHDDPGVMRVVEDWCRSERRRDT